MLDLITVFKYAVGVYKEGGGSPFTRRYMEKRIGNGYRLPWERFLLDMRNNLFMFLSEDHKSLEQPPQECGRIPITADFQDAVGQGDV